MKKQKHTAENTESEYSSKISKKTLIEIGVVISAILLILGESTVQTYFQELYFAGQLSVTHEWLASHFFNHIGNTTDGFGYVTGLIVIPELFRIFSKHKDNQAVAFLMKFYYVLVFIFIGYVINDAETTQQFTGLFRNIGIDPGIPQKSDILAGYYGMFAGIAFYDLVFGINPQKNEE